jgi:four helix bundle protein
MGAFRFQNLEIWKRAAVLNRKCFELADQLEKKHLYRFAEQLRAAALSITINIAEGSGSSSNADFANFLNFARRSVYETANMLLLLAENRYFDVAPTKPLLQELEEISRMITSFKKSLKG